MKLTKEQRTRISNFMRDRRNERFARQQLDSAAEALESDFNDILAMTDDADKLKAGLKSEVEGLQKEKADLIEELPTLRGYIATEKKELANLQAEKAREVASLDKTISEKKGKLAAIENAINEKAQVLGGLIVKELI